MQKDASLTCPLQACSVLMGGWTRCVSQGEGYACTLEKPSGLTKSAYEPTQALILLGPCLGGRGPL